MNAHRPRAPRKHSLRGWNPGGGCRAPRDGGWGNTSNQSRVTSNYHHCHCEGARNVENVVVRLWQSSAICLRANARSAFLFTGSPRSFHSLAMTKGTKFLILHSLTTPAASRHPSNGGELSPQRQHNKFPSAEGWFITRSLGEE